MSNQVKAAERTAVALGWIKWTVAVLCLLGGAGAVQVIYSATTWPMGAAVPVVIGALAAAVLSWALIGWRQHMLQMEIRTADCGCPPDVTLVTSGRPPDRSLVT